jgi:hypothetical protein
MAEPGRNIPKSAPLPVSGPPAKGILVGTGKRVVKRPPSSPRQPLPLEAIPAPKPAKPDTGHWRSMLTGALLLLIAAAIFVGGMEVGYWRSDRRYDPIVKELNDTTKRQAETLAAKEKQLQVALAKILSVPAPTSKDEPRPVAKQEPKKKAEDENPLLAALKKAEQSAAKEPEKKAAEKKVEPPPKVAAIVPKPAPPMPAPTPVPTAKVNFSQHILPIFQAKCFTCHGAGKKKGGLDVSTLASTIKGGNGGNGVEAGKLDDSLIWTRVADDSMPPSKNKLTAAEKTKIKDWILQGGK